MAAQLRYSRLASKVDDEDVVRSLKRTIFAIPSINGAAHLERMLPTLNIPPEMVVVLDQGSRDNTAAICEEFGVGVRQLNQPHTYTQCCNIALEMAAETKTEFLFISNNDIRFSTDVVQELLYEMLSDEFLGIVSCSQLIVDENSNNRILSNRVYWNLDVVEFEHDLAPIPDQTYRLESDFCELTCALIRVSAAVEIGGFDNAYGFYHEDADFGFRLRQAGYSAAYLPQSQIQHFSGSTFRQGLDKRRLNYISRSKDVFTKKHLGLGLRYMDHKSTMMSSWSIINQNLYPYIVANGLLDSSGSELVFSHPGERPFDYLYSVWETSRLPEQWHRYSKSYKGAFLPSQWNLEVFRAEGFKNTHYVPLGIETDTFNIWGPSARWYEEPTYLWFARDQYRKGLDVMVQAWNIFLKGHSNARLVVMGYGIADSDFFDKEQARRWQQFLIYDDMDSQISFREILTPISNRELAAIYRSVDCVVSTSRSEGFGFSVVESMACGTMSIFPGYGATADMNYQGALSFDGQVVEADYRDKGFSDVGHWWEPNLDAIVAAMSDAHRMDDRTRKLHARRSHNMVRGKFTWRNTVSHIRKALESSQERSNLDWTRMDRSSLNLTQPQRTIVEILSDHTLLNGTLNSALSKSSIFSFATTIEQLFISFDQDYYFSVYSDVNDVANMPLWHFILHGCLEERRPSRDFSARQYVLANRDISLFIGIFHGLLPSPYRGHLLRSFAQWEENNLFQCIDDEKIATDEDFIKLCLQVLLRRAPDESSLKTYLPVVETEMDGRIAVIEGIVNSSERKSLIAF